MPTDPTPYDDTQSVITITDNPHTARLLLIVVGGLLLVGGAALICGFTVSLLPVRLIEQPVTLLVDGGAQPLYSRAPLVADLLREQNISINEGDIITPGLNTPITAGLIVSVERSRSVTLTIDGQSRIYRTHQTSPAAILSSAGIVVEPADYIVVDGTRTDPDSLAQWPVPPGHITVRRALPLHIIDGDSRITIETTSDTVGEALFDAGISLYVADVVTPHSNTPLQPDMEITIRRSRPVYIIADGAVIETRVSGDTVGDALAEAGLALVGQDYTVPDTHIALLPGVRIRVIRVVEEIVTEQETQPYEHVFQADPALEIDQTRLMQAGRSGISETALRVRYENGIEISRTVENVTVVQEALNQVTAYGTNIVLRTIDTPEGPRQYWRRIRMYATSYHPGSVGGSTTTAIGETLRKGIVAGDPGIMPYGIEVYVPGYGIGKMADTGAMRRRLRIDLGYSDADWVSWSRYVDVYLLAPVPDNILYRLPRE